MTITDTDTTESTAQLVDAYLQLWRQADPDARAEGLAAVFTPDGRHVDPVADAHGYDQLNAMIGAVHDNYPGFTMERTSGIDRYGDQVRFAWKVDLADGTNLVNGVDVGELSADGRFLRIAGFWGDLPPA